MMSNTEKQTVDELLQTTRLQIQVMALEAIPHILAAHGCKNWQELELKMAEQILAERLAENGGG